MAQGPRADSFRRALSHALAFAPGLGPLAVAVGLFGLNRTARICATRRVPRVLREAWDEVGYRIEQLPSAESLRLLLVGIEVHHALCCARRSRPETPLAVVVTSLGHKRSDVIRGLRLVRGYGVRTMVDREEIGAF